MQYLLDESAYFNLLSVPHHAGTRAAIYGPNQAVIGFRADHDLHRFVVTTQAPEVANGIQAVNVVGEKIGHCTQRWMLIPDNFYALPGTEPPPTVFDPSRTQRFAMMDAVYRFGQGADGFRGFGTGFTVPVSAASGKGLPAVTVGTILEGYGAFAGHEQSLYAHAGTMTPEDGFTGNLLLRVVDLQKTFHSDRDLPGLEVRPEVEPGVTYVMVRGQAREEQVVQPIIGPNGQFQGLRISQDLRLCHMDCSNSSRHGLQTSFRIGPVVGVINSVVVVNPTDPRGTALSPLPGTVTGEFIFYNGAGQATGSFQADFSESRSFRIHYPGASGLSVLLAGNVGRIFGGTGPFAGLTGLITDNLLVSFQPHVSSGIYVFRINDPDGRFRAAMGGS
jgi:hypothetical protein